MTKRRYKVWLLTLFMCLSAGVGMSARTLPVLNRFSNRSFDGTVQVSWPVLFEGCTFRTDSIVLSRSYGALFRNCVFESRSGVLYMAGGGDGMILADCELKGCRDLRFSPVADSCSRNYVSGVTIDGREYEVPDDCESVIDMDGLPLRDIVDGTAAGPLFIQITADKTIAHPNDTVSLKLMGLDEGEFVGWRSSVPYANVTPDGPLSCSFIIPDVGNDFTIYAYTEYGLEAACTISVEYIDISYKKRSWLWRLFHPRKR